jgi:hypothetical protein
MTLAPVGGLRARLIRDSFEKMLRDALDARGWFDTDRRHSPITLISGAYDWDEPIPLNTLSIAAEDLSSDEIELGSNAAEDRWTVWVDFYAESEPLGMDVAHDIRDILRGKMPAIDRIAPIFPVLDFTVDLVEPPEPPEPPPILFYCDIEDVVVDRARGFTRPHERYWYAVRCDIVDEFFDEEPVP